MKLVDEQRYRELVTAVQIYLTPYSGQMPQAHIEAAQTMARLAAARSSKIFTVIHQAFATDTLAHRTDLFAASSPEEALEIYNKMAASEKYHEYPYCWRPVTLENVREAEYTVYSRADLENER